MFPTSVRGFSIDGKDTKGLLLPAGESFSWDYFPQTGWCIAGLLTHPWMGSQCRYRDKIPHTQPHPEHKPSSTSLPKMCQKILLGKILWGKLKPAVDWVWKLREVDARTFPSLDTSRTLHTPPPSTLFVLPPAATTKSTFLIGSQLSSDNQR